MIYGVKPQTKPSSSGGTLKLAALAYAREVDKVAVTELCIIVLGA